MNRLQLVVLVACGALVCAACGGGSSPTTPSTNTPGGSTTPTTGTTTVTITSSGVSPKSLAVPAGTQVTFVNNDVTVHDMSSNPHPDHTDCPEINQVGFLSPGQSRQSAALRTARSCGYHDHNQPTTSSLQGTIVVQ